MAYVASDELLAALEANGITPKDTRRVVIDLQVNNVPVIHIEKWGDRRILKVTEALTGVEIRRVESPGD